MAKSPSFELQPVPPFRLDLTVWTLRRRPENTIDRWDEGTYRRVLAVDGESPYEVAVSQSGPPEAPRLTVTARGESRADDLQASATCALQHLLGLQIDLSRFYRLVDGDPDLGPLTAKFRGFKPPRFSTYFETLVNAMACQQISLTVGIRLLGGLADRYGPAVGTEDGVYHAFPRPQDVADADPDEMRAMGFSHQKARYITGLAQAIIKGGLELGEFEKLDDDAARGRLLGIKGVGRWTAEYFLLRGLGRTHIFPADDVGAQKNLQQWLRLRAPMAYEKVQQVLKPWKGFGGLVYFHLLLKGLDEKGILVN